MRGRDRRSRPEDPMLSTLGAGFNPADNKWSEGQVHGAACPTGAVLDLLDTARSRSRQGYVTFAKLC